MAVPWRQNEIGSRFKHANNTACAAWWSAPWCRSAAQTGRKNSYARACDRALSRISKTLQARSETPDFHIDWSTSWGTIGGDAGLQFIELTFVDHAESWPYVVMSQCKIMCNPAASKSFLASIANGKRELYIRDALMLVLKKLKKREMTMLIDSSLPQRILEKVQVNKEKDFLVEFSCRRMGSDNGVDTLYHMDENLRRALEHMNETLYQPQQT